MTFMCTQTFFSVVSLHVFHTEDEEEKDKVKRAEECCKKILNHVNQAVKEAENKQVEFAAVDFFSLFMEQMFQRVACFPPQRDYKSTRDGWTSHH